MRNRKVSRPALVHPAPPENVRLIVRYREAYRRLSFWLGLTILTAVEGVGVLCLGHDVGDDMLVTGAVLLTVTPFAMWWALAAWNELREMSRRIAKQRQVLAAVRSQRLH